MHTHQHITPAPARIQSHFRIALALAAVYLIWGSTYLATRIGVASLPPLLMNGARFLLAGALLAAVIHRRAATPIDRAAWGWAVVTGGLLFGGGMGGIALASQSIVSSITATGAATIPLWTTLFAGLWGEWPRRTAWFAIALGLMGVVLLQWDGNLRASPQGALFLALAPISWSFGSALKRRLGLRGGLRLIAAEMLAGGMLLTLAGLARGERLLVSPDPAAVAAMVYLVLIGGIVVYLAYAYLLEHVAPALATSYAFVNPIIAMLLGATLGGEQVTVLSIVAMLVIVASVVVLIVPATVKIRGVRGIAASMVVLERHGGDRRWHS